MNKKKRKTHTQKHKTRDPNTHIISKQDHMSIYANMTRRCRAQ